MQEKLVLIDGSSYIFRAFFGVKANLSSPQGLPTNAVYGFKNMLLQLLAKEDPSHVVMVFDTPGPTFRNRIYPLYKANREAPPEDLKLQFEPIFELVQHFNLCTLKLDDYEADDIIGSLAQTYADQIEVLIVSGDKDLTQLVTDQVKMYDSMNDRLYGPFEVQEKFKVPPAKIAEYLALIGDTSDNIPGAEGVGPKTAEKLFADYGSIAGIYENLHQIKGKLKEKLEQSKERVEVSQKLTPIVRDLKFTQSLADFARQEPHWDDLRSFYQAMGFRQEDFLKLMPQGQKPTPRVEDWDYDSYELITHPHRLQEIAQAIQAQGSFAIDLETTSLLAVEAQIVGVALAWPGGAPCYVPVGHLTPDPQMSLEACLQILTPLIQDPKITKLAQNIKYEMMVLANYGVVFQGPLQDSMIESYLQDPNARHNLDDLSFQHLGHRMIAYEEVTGKGKNQIPFAQVPLEQALRYAAEDADATWKIHQKLYPGLKPKGLEEIYQQIEVPLAGVLAQMERRGVRIDVDYLQVLRGELQEDLDLLEGQIHREAGGPFNINSTQQLGKVLFEDLGIAKAKKKIKTGYSTDAKVLEELANDYEIARLLLEYRSKTKLINTYLDVLPGLVSAKTGRVHTSYSQIVAATGRLSSSNPNLQNIPIKGKDGNRMRRAFVPEPGFVLLSADYSQIELRFLAHLSQDENLIRVYQEGGDIHQSTAAAIFGCEANAVTDDMRQAAKAINFGIIYGMGAYRLAQETGVSNAEAKRFIDAYFQRYPRIKEYMDQTLDYAREHGEVRTLLGRVRPLPDIHAKNHMVRTATERVAINSRIQGSAADLIKLAMIQIEQAMAQAGCQSRMIMQVHDELVFEMHPDELAHWTPEIRRLMEQAQSLAVPLKVEIGQGANWQEAH